jgi:fluoride ion exporter CrcB/FEX
MLRDGRAGPALGYAAASLLGGVALAAVGVWLGGRLAARRGPAAPAAVR